MRPKILSNRHWSQILCGTDWGQNTALLLGGGIDITSLELWTDFKFGGAQCYHRRAAREFNADLLIMSLSIEPGTI